MGFKPIDWYCQPEANGVWAKAVGAFGSYKPCAMDSLVICISHLVLFGLCCYRIWMIKKNLKSRRFRLRSNYYNYLLGLLAGYSTAEPILRLVMGLSLFNPYGNPGFAPFEMTSSVIEALAWCCMLILIGLETKTYIREFRWYVKFGVPYVLVGDAVVLNLIIGVTDYCSSLTSSQNDLQRSDIEDENNILMKTKDAVITLQGVLEGKHDKDIDISLLQHHIPREGWWSAFFRIVEGPAVMGRLAHNRLHPLEEDDFEDKSLGWS